MGKVVISGHEIHSELDFPRTLGRLLEFGPYYGNNLDALWDRMTTDVEKPVHLVWEHAAESRQHIGGERFDRIAAVLRKVEVRDREAGLRRRFTLEISE